MRRVVFIKSNLLPISEVFIKEQVLALQNWTPILMGENYVYDGLDLTGIDTIIYNQSQSYFNKKMNKIRDLLYCYNSKMFSSLKKINPDIIHAQFATDGVKYWPTIKKLNKPLVVHLRGNDITIYKEHWYKQSNFSMKLYPRRLLEMSKSDKVHFVAVSEAIRQRAIEYGLPKEKIRTIYSGIDLDKFPVTEIPMIKRPLKILFVGRLIEKKGIMYLLKAFKEVLKEIPQAKLVIAGNGKLFGEAQDFSVQNNLQVEFLGAITHAEVQNELQTTRIFCLPSICAKNGNREGLPNVIKEAQLSGIPVVTSAFGGKTEGIIDGVTGFSFMEKDILTLKGYLIKLLKDDLLSQSMAEKAVAFARERFDMKKCTSNLETFYDSLM